MQKQRLQSCRSIENVGVEDSLVVKGRRLLQMQPPQFESVQRSTSKPGRRVEKCDAMHAEARKNMASLLGEGPAWHGYKLVAEHSELRGRPEVVE